jgi:hypothetical protein
VKEGRQSRKGRNAPVGCESAALSSDGLVSFADYSPQEVDLAQFGAKGRKEALKEVAFLNAMHHPCIVAYREFFEQENAVRKGSFDESCAWSMKGGYLTLVRFEMSVRQMGRKMLYIVMVIALRQKVGFLPCVDEILILTNTVFVPLLCRSTQMVVTWTAK